VLITPAVINGLSTTQNGYNHLTFTVFHDFHDMLLTFGFSFLVFDLNVLTLVLGFEFKVLTLVLDFQYGFRFSVFSSSVVVIVVNRNKFSGCPFLVVVNLLITAGVINTCPQSRSNKKKGNSAREWQY
jgi:hypothetical protein